MALTRTQRLRVARWVTGGAMTWMLIACNNLFHVTDPNVVQSSSLDTPSGALLRAAGANGKFGQGVSQAALAAGMLADEFRSTGALSALTQIDQRVVPLYKGLQVSYPYDALGTARIAALRAIASLARYNPTQRVVMSQMFAVLGYTEVMFAENMCSGLSLGAIDSDGTPQYGRTASRGELLTIAQAHFDSALSYGGDDATSSAGLDAHRLWVVDPAAHGMRRLASLRDPLVEEVLWQQQKNATTDSGATEIIVRSTRAAGSDHTELLALTLAGPTVTRLDPLRVPRGSEVLDYSPRQRQAVIREDVEGSTSVQLADAATGRVVRTLLSINTHLMGVAAPATRVIRYMGSDGDSLTAIMALPADYRPGHRIPLVTWVYAGNIETAADTAMFGKTLFLSSPPAVNLNLLCSAGYGVLVPSMPLPPAVQFATYYGDLSKGVLPAVDRAIALGIADPHRLAVAGHSFGGFSTYALITQTSRFQAAIALAGVPDLLMFYGAFGGLKRYESTTSDILCGAWYREHGQPYTGGPPWERLWKYVATSPLTYVDRVTTPLLMVHGDFDDVPIAGAEEYFSALVRLGKTVRFIRYWGEGHVLQSPANIRHLHTEIVNWLAKYMPVRR